MSIKIFLCKEEKLDLTNTETNTLSFLHPATRHPWPDSRSYLLFSIHVTPSHPNPFTLHIYSVLCPLHIINHSAWVCTSINQTWAYPSKKILYLLWYLLYFYKYLHRKKMRKYVLYRAGWVPRRPFTSRNNVFLFVRRSCWDRLVSPFNIQY